MGKYRVVLALSAERDLQDLPRAVRERVVSAIDRLAENARPRGVRKLRGTMDLWRVRVGDYRVIYHIDDSGRLIDITHIRHRRDAYE
ncbi:MAG: type II toxin-antitoxin system RelE/ParE family toxin [Candidatus Rokubacteria bacterium]|nr:type II toxin-antitoxin system RelE/ParE family toxin [Candidatus Rokubacteria bacterium]